ncbi:hypothetical protein T440DRAFT_510208 [Plenodomus tracheiphilus IPT5]|uniref:Uncharacterized protein n=1 Tax=Plenodomus tracheiphilus IPT5 TaxID=1408161 RepID=A0A6A7AY94_9PLEO|nr:hypothetical protein T440DRAFT_510208 [Plenodomus tracheiphilus IPT5]
MCDNTRAPNTPKSHLLPFHQTCHRPSTCSHHRTPVPDNILPSSRWKEIPCHVKEPVVLAFDGNSASVSAPFCPVVSWSNNVGIEEGEEELEKEKDIERLRSNFAVMYGDCAGEMVKQAARVCRDVIAMEVCEARKGKKGPKIDGKMRLGGSRIKGGKKQGCNGDGGEKARKEWRQVMGELMWKVQIRRERLGLE